MALPGPRSPAAQVRLAVDLLRRPAPTLVALYERYGPVVAFGVRRYRYVALFGPEANRLVLADHPERFRWRDAMEVLVPVDGETALVVSDGEEHRRRRRLVQPAFATKAVHGYLDVMAEEAARELGTWAAGTVVDAYARLRRVILRVAVRSLFGDSLGARADELGRVLAVAVEFVNRPLPLRVEVDLPGTAWRRTRAARAAADAIVDAEVARRRTARAGGAALPAEPADVLDVLLAAVDDGLTDQEVRDQVVSLVAAGYDTTSAAAAWAVHELLGNDGAWARAAAEVDEVVGEADLSVAHLARMPYLDAVVHETLRLWPPGFASGRRAVEAFELAGHRVPAGSMILWSPYVTHRSPDVWPEPDRFRPERWFEGEPEPYTFVPFGGGYRRCIGFAFALQELKAVLVELLRRWDLAPVPRPVVPTGTVSLHPKGGLPVRVVGPRR